MHYAKLGGRCILYRGPNAIMAVDVETDSDFVPGRPRALVDAPLLEESDYPLRA